MQVLYKSTRGKEQAVTASMDSARKSRLAA